MNAVFIGVAATMFAASLYTLSGYSREGDVNNTLDQIDKESFKIKKVTPIVDGLYKIAVYKSVKVRWHILLTVALAVTVIVLSVIGSLSVRNVVLTFPFLFAGLYIPHVWETTHVYSGLTTEATVLYTKFQSILSPSLSTSPAVSTPRVWE